MIRIPGNPRYVSPEVYREGEVALSRAADIWAIGCIGYELITGSPLFESADEIAACLARQAVDPSKFSRLGSMPKIREILSGCLTVNHSNRWSVWDLIQRLDSNR